MTDAYEILDAEEKEKITHVIRALLGRTYIPEWKYDKKQKRMKVNQDFRICEEHLEFIRDYFNIADIRVNRDFSNGVIYLDGGDREIGARLSEYATKFVLILKIIFDEQMSTASTGMFVSANRGEVQEKMAGFNLMTRQPAGSDIRNTLRLLKKYQIIDFLDNGDETELTARFMIYSTVNMVLLGEDVRKLVEDYCANGEKEPTDQTEEPSIHLDEEGMYGSESEI
jgi:hypothetical protein